MVARVDSTVVGFNAGLNDITRLKERTTPALRIAVNFATKRGRTASKDAILSRVAFPPGYLQPGTSGQLQIGQAATNATLESSITAKGRATSLARFSNSRSPGIARRQGGVSVSVTPGSATFIRGAFLLSLNGGNLGLAIRTTKGIKNARNAKPYATTGRNAGLYLLYGPSVYQVFASVRPQMSELIGDLLEREYTRQLNRE